MLSRMLGFGLNGIEGYPVSVEVDVSSGIPSYEIVGLPDAAVRESRERVRSAIKNSGFDYPNAHITINLAPAAVKKEGSLYDLPIALGLLSASGQLRQANAEGLLFIGELSLDGILRGVSGITPMLICALENGVTRVLLSRENAAEASYVRGMTVFACDSLGETVRHLSGEHVLPPCPEGVWDAVQEDYDTDFSEIRGQQGARRAMEVAVAGGHNLLLVGTPGSGKTLLARSIPSILPELTFEEGLEITKLHSAAGIMSGAQGIITKRPFRSPHHASTSASALAGGGQKATPGEISLAHLGVLFLDEFPEFRRDAIEALRQPMEDRCVSIVRAGARSTYPADFMLVAAMNPCPCGNFGSKTAICRCTPAQIRRYRARVSGPMLDRLDIHVEMTEVDYSDISAKTPRPEGSRSIRERVNKAREIQRTRFRGTKILHNAQMTNRHIQRWCAPDSAGAALLEQAYMKYNLSARAYQRLLRVSRTIADLSDSEHILPEHIAEAIQYRSIDQKYWE